MPESFIFRFEFVFAMLLLGHFNSGQVFLSKLMSDFCIFLPNRFYVFPQENITSVIGQEFIFEHKQVSIVSNNKNI